jgi:hypothetical protein
MAHTQTHSSSSKRKSPKATFASDLDSSPQKGKNTRGTKGEQMRVDPEAHGLVKGKKDPIGSGATKKKEK